MNLNHFRIKKITYKSSKKLQNAFCAPTNDSPLCALSLGLVAVHHGLRLDHIRPCADAPPCPWGTGGLGMTATCAAACCNRAIKNCIPVSAAASDRLILIWASAVDRFPCATIAMATASELKTTRNIIARMAATPC